MTFVHEGARLPGVWTQLQRYLGSKPFVPEMKAQMEQKPAPGEIPWARRRAVTQPLAEFERRYRRNEAVAQACLSGRHSMTE